MLSFYGKDGLYPEGITADEVLLGTVEYIRQDGVDKFEGDSVDRERIIYIILNELRTTETVKAQAEEFVK